MTKKASRDVTSELPHIRLDLARGADVNVAVLVRCVDGMMIYEPIRARDLYDMPLDRCRGIKHFDRVERTAAEIQADLDGHFDASENCYEAPVGPDFLKALYATDDGREGQLDSISFDHVHEIQDAADKLTGLQNLDTDTRKSFRADRDIALVTGGNAQDIRNKLLADGKCPKCVAKLVLELQRSINQDVLLCQVCHHEVTGLEQLSYNIPVANPPDECQHGADKLPTPWKGK